MHDPAESQAPVSPSASSDPASRDAQMQQRDRVAERGNSPRPGRRAGSGTSVLVRRIVAGAALTGLTELALGRRLYFAWEALRRAAKWMEETGPPKQPATEQKPQQPTAPSIPSPQEAMEEVVQEVIDWSQRTVERSKPTFQRARKRIREQLKEPHIGAAMIGGAALGAVASVGVIPAVAGAGTAYLLHRKLSSKHSSRRR